MNNKDLKKRVDIEQNFAKYVLKDFKQKRYGICSDANQKQLEKFQIKKELYQWSDWYNPKDLEIDYKKTHWDPTIDPIPPWAGECNNGCTYPLPFIPSADQVADNVGQGFLPSGPTNVYRRINPSTWFNQNNKLPNNSNKGYLTVYAHVDPQLYDANVQAYPEIYGVANTAITFVPRKVPVAQFYMMPIISTANGPEITHQPFFKYPEPSFSNTELNANPNLSTILSHTTPIEIDGETYYYDPNYNATLFYFTMFGNTVKNFQSGSLNGGLYYEDDADQQPLSYVWVDGNDVYNLTPAVVQGGNTYTNVGAEIDEFQDATYVIYQPSSLDGMGNPINTGDAYALMGYIPMLDFDFISLRSCTYSPMLGTSTYIPTGSVIDIQDWIDLGEVSTTLPCTLPGYNLDYDGTSDVAILPAYPSPPQIADASIVNVDSYGGDCCPEGYNMIVANQDCPDKVLQLISWNNGNLNTLGGIGWDPCGPGGAVYPLWLSCEGWQLHYDNWEASEDAGGVYPSWMNYPVCVHQNAYVENGVITLGANSVNGCIEDIEVVHIHVTDQNGNPIEGYEIILDGGNAGFTNELGQFVTTIQNASEQTKHTINICYCFETTGWCAQKLIELVIQNDEIINNTVNGVSCVNISDSE